MYLNGVNKQEGGKELRLIRTWDVFKSYPTPVVRL